MEHHARTLHWDLRLEGEGVLLSWALPKGVPVQLGEKRLAVRTEDHQVAVLDFEAVRAQAGAAGFSVVLRDSGGFERATWLPDSRIVVTLHGRYWGLDVSV
ncbi:DNA polymerase ligase N-terminal domain-containing protein [Rathayibacter sp. Leaf248]|uniref:DNA polymerase ligase N-terminal domain-containing protein n=1 Tax=Rathayibacter sp. Leaf248 TaxID=2876555 RepID=UPI002E7A9DCD|nr:DNA polymerase ligase N-terminal domain-containing protein [Rathayibacter sp. Leaf248]